MIAKPLPGDDLDAVVELAGESFAALRGARVFVTGGTGFFGHWLLESLLYANHVMGLGVRVTVLTRDAGRFRAASPWIAEDPAVTLIEGDVRTFDFPAEKHSHLIHAATDSGGQQDESALAEEIVAGTQRVLSFAKQAGVKRLLYVSSGAVYGRGVTDVDSIPETYPLGAAGGAYDEAKRTAETLCLESGTASVVARCFAFVGPRLPLDAHFAIGNFLGAALRGETITIAGDGTPRRSWMYMSDLAAWLWTLLVRGNDGRAYNVGSEEAYSIAEAANLTAQTLAPHLPVEIAQKATPGIKPSSYVPSVARARAELGLQTTAPLAEALRKTAAWHRS